MGCYYCSTVHSNDALRPIVSNLFNAHRHVPHDKGTSHCKVVSQHQQGGLVTKHFVLKGAQLVLGFDSSSCVAWGTLYSTGHAELDKKCVSSLSTRA